MADIESETGICVVMKPFEADGLLESGTIVDASNWRMRRQLLEQKYLRPASKREVEQFQTGAPAKPKTAAKPKIASKTKTAKPGKRAR